MHDFEFLVRILFTTLIVNKLFLLMKKNNWIGRLASGFIILTGLALPAALAQPTGGSESGWGGDVFPIKPTGDNLIEVEGDDPDNTPPHALIESPRSRAHSIDEGQEESLENNTNAKPKKSKRISFTRKHIAKDEDLSLADDGSNYEEVVEAVLAMARGEADVNPQLIEQLEGFLIECSSARNFSALPGDSKAHQAEWDRWPMLGLFIKAPNGHTLIEIASMKFDHEEASVRGRRLQLLNVLLDLTSEGKEDRHANEGVRHLFRTKIKCESYTGDEEKMERVRNELLKALQGSSHYTKGFLGKGKFGTEYLNHVNFYQAAIEGRSEVLMAYLYVAEYLDEAQRLELFNYTPEKSKRSKSSSKKNLEKTALERVKEIIKPGDNLTDRQLFQYERVERILLNLKDPKNPIEVFVIIDDEDIDGKVNSNPQVGGIEIPSREPIISEAVDHDLEDISDISQAIIDRYGASEMVACEYEKVRENALSVIQLLMKLKEVDGDEADNARMEILITYNQEHAATGGLGTLIAQVLNWGFLLDEVEDGSGKEDPRYNHDGSVLIQAFMEQALHVPATDENDDWVETWLADFMVVAFKEGKEAGEDGLKLVKKRIEALKPVSWDRFDGALKISVDGRGRDNLGQRVLRKIEKDMNLDASVVKHMKSVFNLAAPIVAEVVKQAGDEIVKNGWVDRIVSSACPGAAWVEPLISGAWGIARNWITWTKPPVVAGGPVINAEDHEKQE